MLNTHAPTSNASTVPASKNTSTVTEGTLAHSAVYADYAHMNVNDHVIAASLTIATLFKDVSSLIPQAGPLSQILGAIKELLTIVNEVRDLKDKCEFLIERILNFIKGLTEEIELLDEPLQFGTPIAGRLFTLLQCVEQDSLGFLD